MKLINLCTLVSLVTLLGGCGSANNTKAPSLVSLSFAAEQNPGMETCTLEKLKDTRDLAHADAEFLRNLSSAGAATPSYLERYRQESNARINAYISKHSTMPCTYSANGQTQTIDPSIVLPPNLRNRPKPTPAQASANGVCSSSIVDDYVELMESVNPILVELNSALDRVRKETLSRSTQIDREPVIKLVNDAFAVQKVFKDKHPESFVCDVPGAPGESPIISSGEIDSRFQQLHGLIDEAK